MAEDAGRARYQSYLLRVWHAGGSERTTWRVSLEETRTGERRTFPTLEALFAFLDAPVGQPAARASPRGDPRDAADWTSDDV